MKQIEKRTEPIGFRRWLERANPDWKPSYDKLQSPQKGELH